MPVILKLSSGERASLNSLARRNDDVAEAIMDLADNSLTAGIHTGLMLAVPTAASTQATGTGATVWNIGLEKGVVIVDGVAKEFAAQDVAVHSATQLVADGQSCVAAVIARNVAGTITVISVKGAAATTGAEVAPTVAAIQAAAGAGVSYVKLGEGTINRTGDLTVTQTQDNTKRTWDPTFS